MPSAADDADVRPSFPHTSRSYPDFRYDRDVRNVEDALPVVLSVILPVRNEGPNLRVLLRLLPAALNVPHEVLVVYDRPDDDSLPVVDAFRERYPNLRAVHNERGVGMPNAIRTGVEEARGEFVLIFAADDIAPWIAIEDMLALMERGCDFVASTRYAHGGRRIGGHPVGAFLSRVANRLYHRFAGSAWTDPTSGRVMFRRKVFHVLDPQAPPIGWVVVYEMTMRAEILGLRLGEVPIISVDRLYGGRSTFRVGSWTIEYLRWFFWGARELRRRRERREPLRPEPRVALPASPS